MSFLSIRDGITQQNSRISSKFNNVSKKNQGVYNGSATNPTSKSIIDNAVNKMFAAVWSLAVVIIVYMIKLFPIKDINDIGIAITVVDAAITLTASEQPWHTSIVLFFVSLNIILLSLWQLLLVLCFSYFQWRWQPVSGSIKGKPIQNVFEWYKNSEFGERAEHLWTSLGFFLQY